MTHMEIYSVGGIKRAHSRRIGQGTERILLDVLSLKFPLGIQIEIAKVQTHIQILVLNK